MSSFFPGWRPRGAACRAALTCIAILAAAAAHAQGPDPQKQFPVVLTIEGEPVRTNIVLSLPLKPYGRPIQIVAAAATQLDDDERVFVQFAEALRTNDVRPIRQLLYAVPVDAAQSQAAVSLSPRSPEQLLAGYRGAFTQFANVTLEGRVPLDDGILFLWRAPTAKGPTMLRGFVVRIVEGRRRVSEVTMAKPTEVFIVNTLGQLSAAEFATPVPAAAERNSTLPLTRTGVRIEFQADRLNADVFAAAPAAIGPVATLQAGAHALKDRRLDDLFAVHTAKSTAKLKQWFGTMTGDAFDGYVLAQSAPRFVKLVVEGGPIAIVFSAPSPGDDWAPGLLRHEYLRQTGGRWQIANVLYETFFDDLLKATPAVPRLVKARAR